MREEGRWGGEEEKKEKKGKETSSASIGRGQETGSSSWYLRSKLLEYCSIFHLYLNIDIFGIVDNF